MLSGQVIVPVLNWVSPSTIPSNIQDQQSTLAAQLVHQEGNKNIGLLLMPLFSWKEHQLFNMQSMIPKPLVQKGCSLDLGFALMYDKKADERDSRPLLYPGRIITSGQGLKKPNMWLKSMLVREQRTQLAQQVKTKDMDVVEDLDPSALPEVGEDYRHGVNAAERFAHMGDDGAQKLLQALLTGVDGMDRSGVIIVDLNPGVGNFFSAMVACKAAFSFPLYYLGICKNEVHVEWFDQVWS